MQSVGQLSNELNKNAEVRIDRLVLRYVTVFRSKADIRMKKERVYRHEIKFLIPNMKVKELEGRIKNFASIDPHAVRGGYRIRSLYFDDEWDSAYYEKLNGVNNRKKWRIRIYENNMNAIKMECKHKVRAGIYKESTAISREDYEKILSGDALDFLMKRDRLLQKFYVDFITNKLSPRVIVDYERIPYVFSAGDVRITFDQNIRAGVGGIRIEDQNISTVSVFPKNEVILEFKYTQFIPSIFQDILASETEYEISASKYTLCCDKMKELYR